MKGRLWFYRSLSWMTDGGMIPWSDVAVCERRFGEPCKGPVIPVGAMVEYHPFSAKDQSRPHQFGKKVLLEYSSDMHCSLEGIWTGDILVADIEDLGNLDT